MPDMSALHVRKESTWRIIAMASFDSTDGRGTCTLPFTVGDPDPRMTCSHVDRIRIVQPSGSDCDDCVVLGDKWLQLRMCMECGYVGCCDSSKNKHAIEHFQATQHPIARSIEPGEQWAWCYVDGLWFERLVLP